MSVTNYALIHELGAQATNKGGNLCCKNYALRHLLRHKQFVKYSFELQFYVNNILYITEAKLSDLS